MSVSTSRSASVTMSASADFVAAIATPFGAASPGELAGFAGDVDRRGFEAVPRNAMPPRYRRGIHRPHRPKRPRALAWRDAAQPLTRTTSSSSEAATTPSSPPRTSRAPAARSSSSSASRTSAAPRSRRRPWAGVDARLSRYSYLVSLLPRRIIDDLGLRIDLRRRRYSSYTPDPADPARGILVDTADAAATAASFLHDHRRRRRGARYARFSERLVPLARHLFPTVTEPLRTRSAVRAVSATTRCGMRSSNARWARLLRVRLRPTSRAASPSPTG